MAAMWVTFAGLGSTVLAAIGGALIADRKHYGHWLWQNRKR